MPFLWIAQPDLAIRVLKMVLALRSPLHGCIFHSDRGSQYRSHDYQKVLRELGLKASVVGRGSHTLIPVRQRLL